MPINPGMASDTSLAQEAPAVVQATAALEQNAVDLPAKVRARIEETEATLGQKWDGESRAAFRKGAEAMHAKCVEIAKELQLTADFVGDAAKSNDAIDANEAAELTKITAALLQN